MKLKVLIALLIFSFHSANVISQVGVGTSSPQATFEIESSTSTLPVFRITDNSGAEILRVQDDHHIGIGENSPGIPLHVKGGENNAVAQIENTRTGTTADVLDLRLGRAAPQTGNQFIRFFGGSGMVGSVSGDGMGSILYNTPSDERLKENIRPTSYGLSNLLEMEVMDYNYRVASPDKRVTGMLAQDLHKIYPAAVTRGSSGDLEENDPDAIWAVDYSKITPLLVKAIQEQQNQIEALRKEISKLQENSE